MSKFTPGPWFFDDGKEQIFGDGEVIVYETSTNMDDINLICAAPDLLDFATEWLKRQGTDDNYMTAKARAAIAKAKGETNE